jgi:hypothetical protein
MTSPTADSGTHPARFKDRPLVEEITRIDDLAVTYLENTSRVTPSSPSWPR